MGPCSECGGEMLPGPGDRTFICENLMALALERSRAGDKRPVTHEDLRQGLPSPSEKLKAMEAKKRALAEQLKAEMAPGWGFVLAMADFHGKSVV